MDLESTYSAHNYAPLPVTIARGEGAWVEDEAGNRYLDLLSAYSALNFGHRHPRLVEATRRQLDRVTLTSRAFRNDQLGAFCRDLATLCAMDAVLPMNTGAEGVETAIKAARRWGYEVKGVPADRAKVIVFENNFHGRTTTIVGFSTDPLAREGFGPYGTGFTTVKFGDSGALEDALDEETVAVLIEPIQGEAGVVVPPDGYLREVREACTASNALMIADEIQSGLGRTGLTFACEHEGVRPDVYILGKALGGGIMPLSAVVADWSVLGVFTPGSHGSTFGGNPLACAIGREVIAMLSTGEYQQRAAHLGARLLARLGELVGRGITEVRGRGLWAGIDVDLPGQSARAVCEQLLGKGVLAKDTHGRTIRIAPPLVIEEADLDWAVDRIAETLGEMTK
ncbi:MAG: ornithine--oxo-acid transaminase [Actinomycetota bacterium]